ncbi:MAG: radical SAM protein [Polyangiaceae bacterium]|nr:radical SAM protein [Polyangiaceae bacterium]
MSTLISSLSKIAHVASWSTFAVFGGLLPALRERAADQFPTLRSTHRSTPWAISFLVTARCMLKCQHCFYHYATSTPETELSLDEYRTLSRSLNKFTVGLFCGGEPYMRPDLGEIIILLRKNHGVPLAATTTNGHLTASVVDQTQAILNADRYKPFGIGFSLDGPQEVHDLIRGRGSFDRTVRTLREVKRLQRHNPHLSITVTTVVNSINQHVVAEFEQWVARELSPTSQCVLLVRQNPRAGESLKKVDLTLYQQAQQAALQAMRASPQGRFRPDALYLEAVARHVTETRLSGSRSFHCWAGINGALIDATGNVHVCEVLPEQPGIGQIGALRDYNLNFDALWNSPRADEMRALVNTHPVCADCTHETMGHATSLPFPPTWLWPFKASPKSKPHHIKSAPEGVIPVERLRRPDGPRPTFPG